MNTTLLHSLSGRLRLSVFLTLTALAGCGGGDGDGPAAFAPDQSPAQARTTTGDVRGVLAADTVSFLGIPYAAAPTGELRFKAPQPRAAWQGELDASKPGSPCPQASQTTTEDCLFLNVWRPLKAEKPLPVFMWVHGGGFVAGNGGGLNGATLAKAGVIVVTINYRMGIFGYLAHPALESSSRDSGNYGVQDAHAALRWIRDNIAAFGGDPANVTMGGSSGGAMTTCLSSTNPEAGKLFNKQLISSGPCAFQWPTIDQKYVQEAGIPQSLGCTGTNAQIATCLRSPTLTPAQVITAQNTLPQAVVFPSVGGTVAPVQPRQLIGKLPTLMGYAAWELLPNDFSYAGALGTGPLNPQDTASYVSTLATRYGTDAAAIAAAYPLSGFASGNLALNRIEADFGRTPKGVYIATCTNLRNFEIAKAVGGNPLFAYEAADPGDGGNLHVTQGNLFFPTGASTGASLDLSRQQIQYWANFIRSGNPNGAGLPTWSAYAQPTDVLKFGPGPVQTGVDANAAHKCAFWNSLGLGV
ncbi:carboxylesterase family protein [Pigmentiphaga litoralis]|uniref:Para-nitrobenzyl esterase n=1 Tax=Pigmentiphaga litoralis TaxID=516702 RepID=A0A7Y9IU18_9BURK|nr:carboxylesterase family protein [Pigmentiphaga litoralis]NYE23908.1 para-nitrobenzyl esterase [Pigmentiphaga litoralis]NYE82478.1 para-nitrobenzyl esterase [Pigmentiphaga litoralis]